MNFALILFVSAGRHRRALCAVDVFEFRKLRASGCQGAVVGGVGCQFLLR